MASQEQAVAEHRQRSYELWQRIAPGLFALADGDTIVPLLTAAGFAEFGGRGDGAARALRRA